MPQLGLAVRLYRMWVKVEEKRGIRMAEKKEPRPDKETVDRNWRRNREQGQVWKPAPPERPPQGPAPQPPSKPKDNSPPDPPQEEHKE